MIFRLHLEDQELIFIHSSHVLFFRKN